MRVESTWRCVAQVRKDCWSHEAMEISLLETGSHSAGHKTGICVIPDDEVFSSKAHGAVICRHETHGVQM